MYMQSTSCKILGWMTHKLESRLLREIATTSGLQMYHFNDKSEEEIKNLSMKLKEESEKTGLNLNIQKIKTSHQFSSLHSLNHVWLFATSWTAAHQVSLSVTNSQSLIKLMSIESMMPPLSSSSPTFSLSQHQGLFQWVSSSHQMAKVLELQHQYQSFQWTFRTDFL